MCNEERNQRNGMWDLGFTVFVCLFTLFKVSLEEDYKNDS